MTAAAIRIAKIAAFSLSVLPAAVVGGLVGMLFLGMLPTLVMDVFIYEFHYSTAARIWVQWGGRIGVAAGVIAAIFCTVDFARQQK